MLSHSSRSLIFVIVALSACLVQAASPEPPASVGVAHVLRKKSDEPIHNLFIADVRLPLVLRSNDNRLRPLVQLRMQYDRQDWQLLGPDGQPAIKTPGKAEWMVPVYLKGSLNKVSLTAVGPTGARESEIIYIYAPSAKEFKLISPWEEILFSFGMANMVYSQTGFGRFTSVTGAIGVQFTTPNRTSRWGLLGNADMTMLTLHSSPVNAQPQFIGARADISYLISGESSLRWRTQVLGGVNYWTMLSNGSSFGFNNLVAPEFGVRAQRVDHEDRAWLFDLRVIALGVPMKQYGLDFNVNRSWLLQNAHRAQLGLGLRSFSYHPKADVSVQGDFLSLSLGYTI